MDALTLSPINAQAVRVLDEQCNHVGTLKWISGVWKFKAIGYDDHGDVIPGGGPLTERHNTLFESLDTAVISAELLQIESRVSPPPKPPHSPAS